MGSRQDALSLEGLLSVELIDRVGLTWRQKREGRRRTHAGETRRVQEGILEWKEVSHGTVYYTQWVKIICDDNGKENCLDGTQLKLLSRPDSRFCCSDDDNESFCVVD
jgi:hypothetical protein